MRLSPFDPRIPKGTWPHQAPLYGKPGSPNPYDQCSFEVFPIRPGDDTTDLTRVPRDKSKLDSEILRFDIEAANDGTEYAPIICTGDPPKIRWYSRRLFKKRFGYDPKNPPRPQGVSPREWTELAEKRLRGEIDSSIDITRDRQVFLNRIARLWNGEDVCGVHLLADSCPSIKHLTEDLDETSLRRLYYKTDLGQDVLLAFNNADWFNRETSFLKPTYLFRKRLWYDLNHKARELINGWDSFPDLRGDPFEGLTHRVTVGLLRLYDEIRGWNSESYYSKWGYVIDIIGKDRNGQLHAREVITEHNNRSLCRETYEKMRELDRRGVKPVAIFDSRETAYDVFNFWHRDGLGELPNGPFGSQYDISIGREYINDAYHDPDYNWAVADWDTTWKLQNKTIGPNGPELDRQALISLNW